MTLAPLLRSVHDPGVALLTALSCVGCCAKAPPQGEVPQAVTPDTPSVAAPALGAKAPQLVVAVVFDQLGSDTLLRSLPALDPNGLLRTAVAQGVFFERSEYPYANTLTAPGHAAIFTGAPPRTSGIGGNDEWHPGRGQVASVDSPKHPVFGNPNASAGAESLRVPTVGDVLKQRTGGGGKVVAVSLKDRAAIYSSGQEPDLALWYDSSIGRFTSSSYCVPELPGWVTAFQEGSPVAQRLGPWSVDRSYESLLGPDANVGENNFWGSMFPHDVNQTPEPLKMARLLPSLSEYLVELSRAATEHYALGDDDVPDLLVISISGTDYVGHIYGPHSWEYIDHLRRADAAIGSFVSELRKARRVAVMVTSDHGVAPLPERARADGSAAGRVFREHLTEQLETHLDAQFGAADWVAGIIGSFVYFTETAQDHVELSRVVQSSQAYLTALDGVAGVYTAAQARSWVGHAEPLQRWVANSFPEQSHAALLIDTEPHWIFGFGKPPSTGTHHGSRQDYDRQVPLLFFGEGIAARRVTEPVSQLQAAPTLAALLGVPAPSGAEQPALPIQAAP